MDIQTIQWMKKDKVIKINGEITVKWPKCKTWHKPYIQAWIDDDGVIKKEEKTHGVKAVINVRERAILEVISILMRVPMSTLLETMERVIETLETAAEAEAEANEAEAEAEANEG